MRDRVAWKIDGDKCNVRMTVEMGFAGRAHGVRLLLNEKVHDGEIVGRQIPDDADVVLKEPEVNPRGIVVIEVAENTLVNELTDFSYRTGEQEGVVHHDPEILSH